MYKMYFDGGCGPKNPGGLATFGVYINKDGQQVFKAQGVMDETETSNNVAEYGGFITGLNWLLENGLEHHPIQVIGDSKLVISQMFRHWRIKDGLYKKYALHARQLVSQFSDIRGKLVPRHLNSYADSLTHFFSTERVKIPHQQTLI